jgi:hypothetical protein
VMNKLLLVILPLQDTCHNHLHFTYSLCIQKAVGI